MKTNKVFLVLVCCFIMAFVALHGGDVITIESDQQWQNTGITINTGDTVLILGYGMWNSNVSGSPEIWQWHGPNGTGNPAASDHLVPDVSDYSLVGKIGSSEFTVGTYYYHYGFPSSGTLELAVNDWVNGYGDNLGYLMAMILIYPDIVVLGNSTLPRELKLLQNYPNPFNPLTRIPYTVSKYDEVQIVIYNVKGQIVKLLVNEQKSPGEYFTTWDGTDQTGKRLPSGQYFYQLKVGEDMVSTKKAILVK